MQNCLNWNPKDFCRLVGIVTSGSKASIVPVRISRDDIAFVRDEMLVIVDDIDECRRYLGVFKGSTKRDLALDATSLPTSFDPEKSHMYSAPSMVSQVEIIGEITCGGIELNFSIPRPGSYVYTVIDGSKLQKILGIENGLRIGIHKFSKMEIPLDPRALSYHIAILGATGTGKSRLAKCLVEETIKWTDYSVIIFDHTGIDYTDASRWSLKLEVLDASKIVLDPDVISQIIIEETGVTGYHEDYVYGAVVEYIRKKTLELTANHNDLKHYTTPRPQVIDIESLLTTYKEMTRKGTFIWSFSEFQQVLEEYIKRMGGYETTIRKLKLLIATRLGKKFFENYLNNRTIVIEDAIEKVLSSEWRLVVVDLSSEIEYIAKRGIIYQFIKILWDRIWGGKNIIKKRILTVIDEAHNYSCTYGCEPAKSVIAKTVREGRKWGFGVVLATQRVIDLAPEIRGNVNTVFFSRLQSSGDYNELRNWLEGVQYLEHVLPMLSSREFFFAGLGNPLRKPLLVKVRDVD